MQNPKDEIETVLLKLLSTQSPDEQKKAMNRYFTENAGFRGPLYHVAPGEQSREDVLGIYQWLRVVSSETKFEAKTTTFDEQNRILLVEGSILFRPRLSPIPAQPAKAVIVMKLEKRGGDYLIGFQEYFYQPEELITHLFPPILPLVRYGLSVFTYASAIGAKFAQVLGIWRVNDTNDSGGSNGSNSYRSRHAAPDRKKNREVSVDSHTSEETRVGANDVCHDRDSEKYAGGEVRTKVNGKQNRKRSHGHHNTHAHT